MYKIVTIEGNLEIATKFDTLQEAEKHLEDLYEGFKVGTKILHADTMKKIKWCEDNQIHYGYISNTNVYILKICPENQ